MNLTWQFPGKFLNTCFVWENKMQESSKEKSLQADPTANSELMKAPHTSIEDCMQPPPLLNIKCCFSITKINTNNSCSKQEILSNTRRLQGKLLRVICHNRLHSVLRGWPFHFLLYCWNISILLIQIQKSLNIFNPETHIYITMGK